MVSLVSLEFTAPLGLYYTGIGLRINCWCSITEKVEGYAGVYELSLAYFSIAKVILFRVAILVSG
jgi:hypothetical protein